MQYYALLFILILCIILIIVLYFHRKHEERFSKYQEQILKQQIEEVNEIYLTMRGWRHDYHNHMQKLKAHIALNQIDEMKAYLNQLEGELDKIDVKYRTGNVSLDAILNSKLSIAEKAKISINCKVELTENISILDIDLCVLIGNLIDNAVEACDKLRTGEPRFLRIYICIRRQQLYIAVTNATNEVIRKLDREYITQKRGNHGHGLRRIDAIVEKYQGYIKRANEPGVFSTEIMLPLL
jgi:sensor histidine kinase regulating citrate/malate metabolism